MASRLIIVPNTISTRRGDDGRPVEIHTPDFLGFTVENYRVRTDYRDCAKVTVTAPAKVLADLEARSREYFRQLWKVPDPDTES